MSMLKGTIKLAGVSRLTVKPAPRGEFGANYAVIRFGGASAYHFEIRTICDKILLVGGAEG